MLTNREKLVVAWLLSMETMMVTSKTMKIPPERLHGEIFKHMDELRKTNTPDITTTEMMDIEQDIEKTIDGMSKIIMYKNGTLNKD